MTFKPIIVPLCDSGLLVRLGDEIDLTINRRVHVLAALIAASPLQGLIETVPAYGTLLIHYDPLLLEKAKIHEWLLEKLDQIKDVNSRTSWQLTVPVRYGGEHGVDLEFIADYHHLRVDDVIRIHSEKTYTVYMMGFTPGFPYMGILDDAIVTPRLETPRSHVSAGTVAIAGSTRPFTPIG